MSTNTKNPHERQIDSLKKHRKMLEEKKVALKKQYEGMDAEIQKVSSSIDCLK